MVKEEFLQSEHVLSWLGQFDPSDQEKASALLKKMRLVSADDFAVGVRRRLLESADETDGAVALFAERESKKNATGVLPLFEQSNEHPRRAIGEKVLAVDGNVDIGSEGLVAQLITELTRSDENKFLNHPGPDCLRYASGERSCPVRKFILVTDVIGSGNRAWQYLEAAWRVWTVKSLHSMRPRYGISFEVVTYASTIEGQQLVESHPVRPLVRKVVSCPTIDTVFDKFHANEIMSLCRRYDPFKKRWALGYKDTGALIAFAHGVPNNCPRILWAATQNWLALFPKRVSAPMREVLGSVINAEAVNDRLLAMRQRRLDEGVNWSKAPRGALERYLLLAALAHPPRRPDVIARKTGLTLLEVEKLLKEAIEYKWIDSDHRVTDAGKVQLSTAKASSTGMSIPPRTNLYYPSSLRVPTI